MDPSTHGETMKKPIITVLLTIVFLSLSACTYDTPDDPEVEYVEVPGKTEVEYVEVPGETTTETILVEREVEVPGETVYVDREVVVEVNVPVTEYIEVEKEVPGPIQYVDREVIVEVPGETVYVNREIVVKEVVYVDRQVGGGASEGTCEGGDCLILCDGVESCNWKCPGGGCSMQCEEGVVNCDLHCGADGGCSLYYWNGTIANCTGTDCSNVPLN